MSEFGEPWQERLHSWDRGEANPAACEPPEPWSERYPPPRVPDGWTPLGVDEHCNDGCAAYRELWETMPSRWSCWLWRVRYAARRLWVNKIRYRRSIARYRAANERTNDE